MLIRGDARARFADVIEAALRAHPRRRPTLSDHVVEWRAPIDPLEAVRS